MKVNNFSISRETQLPIELECNGVVFTVTEILPTTKGVGKQYHGILTQDGQTKVYDTKPILVSQLNKLAGVTQSRDTTPREPKDTRIKRTSAATWHAKANKLFIRIMDELGEDDNLRFAWVDYLNRKTNELRQQESIEAEKRKQEAEKKKMNSVELKAIKKARIKRLNEYINSYDSKIVEVMAKDITAAQMMMLNKEERIERARKLIAEIGG